MSKKKGYFRTYFFYDLHKVIGLWLWYIFFRPKKIVLGEKATKNIKGGALVCLNHSSFADITYIQLVNPWRHNHIVAAKDALNNKFLEGLLKLLLAVPIDREKFSYGNFRDIVNLLKDGRLVNIYCEGHMNENLGTIDKIKDGVILMAYAAKVPLIPVYVRPRKSKFERLRIGYGEAIYLDELGVTSRDKIDIASKYLHDRLEELMKAVEEDYKNRHNKKKETKE